MSDLCPMNSSLFRQVKMEWAGVKNLQNQLFTLVGLLLFAGGLALVRR